jgi:hypothetical protein
MMIGEGHWQFLKQMVPSDGGQLGSLLLMVQED